VRLPWVDQAAGRNIRAVKRVSLINETGALRRPILFHGVEFEKHLYFSALLGGCAEKFKKLHQPWFGHLTGGGALLIPHVTLYCSV
jgi:hypothetical protein